MGSGKYEGVDMELPKTKKYSIKKLQDEKKTTL